MVLEYQNYKTECSTSALHPGIQHMLLLAPLGQRPRLALLESVSHSDRCAAFLSIGFPTKKLNKRKKLCDLATSTRCVGRYPMIGLTAAAVTIVAEKLVTTVVVMLLHLKA